MAALRDPHAIRRAFLDFFAARGHTIVPSSSLVPHGDDTLLFTNAGMVQFKDVFTGRDTRPYTRAVSAQRCLRAGGKHNDLDNVGFTPRHHTLFEMLGNFSFGDYFKRDAIRYAWEFLTEVMALPEHRLVVSVYDGKGRAAPFDQEAYELWAELVPRERIYSFDATENFWQMGDIGPCGPCSEVHIFRGDAAPPDGGRPGRGPAHETDRYMELWNLVFMQYEQHPDASMTLLPAPCVDTGAGLERIASVAAGVESNYETDLLSPLVAKAKALAGVSGHRGAEEPSFQVIADHARATAFLIADGIFPEKTGREYVLRRIMRRAIRHGTLVGLDAPFFHEVCGEVVDRFSEAYPDLAPARPIIEEVVRNEEASFRRTLRRGLERVDAALRELPAGTKVFPVEVAADLYSTYGFPIDLTGVIAREHGLEVDEDAATQLVRESGGEGGSLGTETRTEDVYFAVEREAGLSTQEFLGYTTEAAEAKVVAIVHAGVSVREVAAPADVELVADRTPFYAESGGQMGDTGSARGGGAEALVEDTHKPTGRLHFHRARLRSGTLSVGQVVALEVDHERRAAIRRNHSATHLLHLALRTVLGPHVIQKGSLVAPDRLRFDFSHGRPLTEEEKRRIEALVAADILDNAETGTREMSLENAKQAGAIGLFGEKYGAEVRVVGIGPRSLELCGGTHVRRAGDIGLMFITTETGIAQGVRRIEAVTGTGALAHVQSLLGLAQRAADRAGANKLEELEDRISRLQQTADERGREVESLQRQLATGGGSGGDAIEDVGGIKLLAKRIPSADPKVMRDAADTLRDRLGSGVVVLAGEREGKANVLVAVTKDLQGRVHAGKLVSVLASHLDGRGGGRPDLAQAGGPNLAGIDTVVRSAAEALRAQLNA